MADDVYPYDTALYDRSFLNCYQRQAMVMLAERVPDLPLLFHHCLVSGDDILEQVVRVNRPKYDFQSRLLDPASLGRLGIVREDVPHPDYAAARPVLLDALRTHGFAIPFIDVYYLPHTPEHRVDHIVHTVTLVDHDAATGEWSILDDNRASVLCRYRYPEQVIADAFDNGRLRSVSWFPTAAYDGAAAAEGSAAAFADVVDGYSDGHALLDGAADLLASPWFAGQRSIALLYDAFSVYEGSRTCLDRFLARTPGYRAVEPVLVRIVGHAKAMRNLLMVGKAIGRVDLQRVATTCGALRDAEVELLATLRATRSAAAGAVR